MMWLLRAVFAACIVLLIASIVTAPAVGDPERWGVGWNFVGIAFLAAVWGYTEARTARRRVR